MQFLWLPSHLVSLPLRQSHCLCPPISTWTQLTSAPPSTCPSPWSVWWEDSPPSVPSLVTVEELRWLQPGLGWQRTDLGARRCRGRTQWRPAGQLQELLPTLAVGWVQEEGLCRADQSVPPAGVGWRACHIVYQDCNGRGGRVFWFERW